MNPQNGIIKDNDGKLYSMVDLLKGNKTPLDRSQIKNNMEPSSAMIIDKDGAVYSLVNLLGNTGSGGGADSETIATMQTEINELKTALEEIATAVK